MTIKIDYTKDELFDDLGLKRLKNGYMRAGETSPQERYAFIANEFSSDNLHAERLYFYMSNHWLSPSTPLLSYGKNKRGLPISCFLPFVPDTSEGLVDTFSEVSHLSMAGGGCGIHFSMRQQGEKSTGALPHLKTYDAGTLAFKQGQTRRGSYAIFLDIDHPEIEIFMEMRKPTGDPNMRCMNLHHGVNVSDKFMEIVEKCLHDKDANDDWDLIDPSTKEVVRTVSVRNLWEKLMRLRHETGEPYIHFVDTSNRHLPEHLKEKGLEVKHSNLCVEITLPANEERTPVCCLSSLNLDYFDEWVDDKLFIQDTVEFLDNALERFILNAPDHIKRARYSAIRERSIGIGALGFHSYLQSKNIPFSSIFAKGVNNKIFSHIKENVDKANYYLGKKRGEAPDIVSDMKINVVSTENEDEKEISVTIGTDSSVDIFRMGERKRIWAFELEKGDFIIKVTRPLGKIFDSPLENMDGITSTIVRSVEKKSYAGKRMSHLTAIAPNATSSIIMGNTSPSIEPFRANCYRQDTLSGSDMNKNRHLDKIIREKSFEMEKDSDKWYNNQWSSIISHDGSVQHLDWLSDDEKKVFETAMEINQRWIIDLAADRQNFLDQSQSVNLFFPPNADISYIHLCHFEAWKKGLKTLYYCRSDKKVRSEKIFKKIERKIIEDAKSEDSCLACEG